MIIMNFAADKLNNQIDLMQADKSPFTHGIESTDAAEIAMLQVAAGLKSLRTGPVGPDAGFVEQLRTLMLAEAVPGTDRRGI
jgi:hypothetical protein